MAGSGTVEFGEDRPVRLLDRLFGDHRAGGFGLSAPAVGAAVVATALFIAAELLPWANVQRQIETGSGPTTLGQTRDLSLDAVGWGVTAGYYIGLMLLLAVVGLAQVSRPHTRRALTAGGIGLAAAMVVLLIGVVRRAGEGGQYGVFDDSVQTTPGAAPYVAIAGVLVAVAALVIAGWHPAGAAGIGVRKRRRPVAAEPLDDDDDGEEPGPIDLTVTPA
jgi:hypothetical protein